ncbi:MAG: ABC transporter ATP-binding protein [Candidatus Cloacimonetes bacterium]|nr:ABC transporter ATP-binding protein [Candidatus Cloacimonadota bacterium]
MIELINIVSGYYDKKVIRNLSANFKIGEFCALLGPNGAGKSTLLKTICGFLDLSQGEINIKGLSIKKWKQKELAKILSLIPQDFQLQFDYTVEDLVLMGRFPYLNYWRNYSQKDKNIVDETLTQLDLDKFKNKLFSQLSGGERQRVSIARALVQQTEVILMDEAFSHLDINHQIEIMELLSRINKNQNKLIILISHNINLASEYCDRIVMMKQGSILADGKPEEIVTKENIHKLYEANLEIIRNPVSGKPNLVYPGKKC